jgi:large subunit ribosomal protein L25
MAKKFALVAEKRDRAGKGVARALRLQNRIPSVLYGDKKEPVLISIAEKELKKEYQKGYLYTHLCDLEIDGKVHLCLARDVQLHPVTDRIEHVDFLRVTPKTKIAVEVPVHFINQENCAPLKAGGVLNIVRHEVELECSATDIPEFIEVDVGGFGFGDSIRISNAKLPANTKPTIDRDFVLATVMASRAASAADEEADAATAAAAAAASAAAAGTAAAPAEKKDEKK